VAVGGRAQVIFGFEGKSIAMRSARRSPREKGFSLLCDEVFVIRFESCMRNLEALFPLRKHLAEIGWEVALTLPAYVAVSLIDQVQIAPVDSVFTQVDAVHSTHKDNVGASRLVYSFSSTVSTSAAHLLHFLAHCCAGICCALCCRYI
jgi:hypothetical protein